MLSSEFISALVIVERAVTVLFLIAMKHTIKAEVLPSDPVTEALLLITVNDGCTLLTTLAS